MKIHRLSREEWQNWRQNRWMIRSKVTGNVIRPCTQAESQKYDGMLRTRHIPTVTVDGEECEIVSSRSIMTEGFIGRYGDVQLRSRDGRMVRVLRDPKLERPKFSSLSYDVLPPELCACRNEGEAHPGRHHPYCALNLSAPPHERARPEDYARLGRETLLELPKEVRPEELRPPTRASSSGPIPSPNECFCRDFGTPNPDPGFQHNVVCQYFNDWAAEHPLRQGYVLMDVDTEEILRLATPEEIQTAALDMAGIITLADRRYQVVPVAGEDDTDTVPPERSAEEARA